MGKLQEEVPTELPPRAWPYVARRTLDGSWEYVNTETGDVNCGFVPNAPEGWQVDWSGAQQSWFWRNCVTGEATLEPPAEERAATSSVGTLVAELQAAGLLQEVSVSARDVKKQYRRYCVQNHPDKCRDASDEDKCRYKERSALFQELLCLL